ncbi:MAG TPA: nitroreductase family protein [Solirubrobacteraceae bacterium]|jgi:nitroreductase|nr:nitroreductase family protein [Solirubrobacteraceae bacterium]
MPPQVSARQVPVGEDAPILEVMATMRAMRRLKPDPVPRELLERLVEAATWAPSGSNEQQYEFVVVDDRETMARLAELWGRSHDAYIGATREEAIGRMGRDKAERLLAALRYQRDHFHETPAIVVPCYQRRTPPAIAARLLAGLGATDAARFLGRARRTELLAEAASVYPGVQNLLLTARAYGLAANITNWHLLLEHEWKRELGIPRAVNTYAVIPIGWPLGRFGPVVRRPAREALHWNRW